MPSAAQIAEGLLRETHPVELTIESPSMPALGAPSVELPNCKACIHVPVCAFFRAATAALGPFQPEKGEGPVNATGLATSCKLFRSK